MKSGIFWEKGCFIAVESPNCDLNFLRLRTKIQNKIQKRKNVFYGQCEFYETKTRQLQKLEILHNFALVCVAHNVERPELKTCSLVERGEKCDSRKVHQAELWLEISRYLTYDDVQKQ